MAPGAGSAAAQAPKQGPGVWPRSWGRHGQGRPWGPWREPQAKARGWKPSNNTERGCSGSGLNWGSGHEAREEQGAPPHPHPPPKTLERLCGWCWGSPDWLLGKRKGTEWRKWGPRLVQLKEKRSSSWAVYHRGEKMSWGMVERENGKVWIVRGLGSPKQRRPTSSCPLAHF